MSFPPPPPNQPPNDAPGGFGPPAGGFGQGGYGQGGYAQPAGQQPPGGYPPPPGGGYGPGGPAGPGGWQQPPVPPSGGGGNGKIIAAIIAGGALVVATVITVVVMNSGGDSPHRAQPAASSATPSDSASATPSDDPSQTPADDATGSADPTPGDGRLPFYELKVGDCYNLPPSGAGNNTSASCNGPHDAEVVTTHELGSGLTSSEDIKQKASSLCKKELASKAARQPSGTAEGTYVQFPNLQGYKLGIKTVSCSLMGNRTNTKKLTGPLS
ncbi:hypothetical protein [Streptomyces gilvosporeus]|uniref:Septum formation-related domain-containing protein n=1 Tax=Streptomyces gilvosporeus TaxID=553510 RepID=A0A1V0U0H6_9ACTN|nr:hypothetical protein [Streptomyces gilvosporeus]ARF58714.1 hypothetical protein B1H19_35045 [Streptomyces gilvosporeus]